MNTMYDFAFSEQGYNHIKSDKVCQDSSGHYSDELMAIAVVADGHGSDNYPRTDRGSSFAVDATIVAIREFVHNVATSKIDISVDSDSYLEQLAKSILANWYATVDSDFDRYPFLEEELSSVSEKYKKKYLAGERKEKAYGTTLIAACQTKDYWFGLQIGDGKCVCISNDGSVSEPIPWDDDCQANVTTSICDSDAIEEFRYCFLKEPPIATFMGTDGIDDSYATSEEMYVLYRSILAIFAEHGRRTGEAEIQEFLPSLSKKGSGDDVSIAGIVSSSLSSQFITVLKAQSEYSNAREQNEKAARAVTLATEKRDYVLSALLKAKSNYDNCIQKANEAHKAVADSKQAQEDAVCRFEIAEKHLRNAITAYQESLVQYNGAEESADGNTSVDSISIPNETAYDKVIDSTPSTVMSNTEDQKDTSDSTSHTLIPTSRELGNSLIPEVVMPDTLPLINSLATEHPSTEGNTTVWHTEDELSTNIENPSIEKNDGL